MKAYQWLGKDGYPYILFCTKADAAEVISRFGPEAKSPTWWINDVKYSFYIINPKDKIITPIRYLSRVFDVHSDPYDPLIGEECSVAIFLDNYRFEEYPFHRK